MAILFVNTTGVTISDAQKGGTSTVTLGWTPVVGNHLIVTVSGWGSSTTMAPGFRLSSVTDSLSNAYNVDKAQADSGKGETQASTSSAKLASAGASMVITLHFAVDGTNGGYLSWCVTEFSGLNTTTWLDQTGSTTQGNVANITATATGANSQAAALVVAAAINAGGSANVHWSTAPATGYSALYTQQDNSVHQSGQGAYKIVSSIETSSAAFTVDAPGTGFGNAAVIATYKPVSGITPLRRNSSLDGLGASGSFFHDPLAMVGA